ncbi:MAG: nitroreductase family protein [Actinobacteria bacterium]|nr:nitroreductase family protein [Actinomycetota bacterium]
MENLARPDHPIHDVLCRRWSPLAFDPGRPIEPATVHALLEAARWAPSARNEQPWRYLVLDSRTPEARAKVEACLSSSNSWAKRAPLLLLSVAQTRFSAGQEPNRWALYDVGAANACLVLQATSLGLLARQIGAYDRDLARQALGIPAEFEMAAILALGYHGDPTHLTPEQQARESRPRTRRPIGASAFLGRWSAPYG